MANPVTAGLVSRLGQRRVTRLVERWDAVEALVVRVYKAGEASGADEQEWVRVRGWLVERWASWSEALEPFWRGVTVQGNELDEDPFAALLSRERAGEFVGDWGAMQVLSAAREALNNWLVAQLEERDS